MPSQTVGLFEAKTHLSEWVSRAERGEEVVITRHSKAVARLVPMTPLRQRGSATGTEARKAAIAALLAFKPISVPDVTVKSLIEAGRK